MEIVPEVKAEASICYYNEILNLTPSDKNLEYRVDVEQGTLVGSKRQKKEAPSSFPTMRSLRNQTIPRLTSSL